MVSHACRLLYNDVVNSMVNVVIIMPIVNGVEEEQLNNRL